MGDGKEAEVATLDKSLVCQEPLQWHRNSEWGKTVRMSAAIQDWTKMSQCLRWCGKDVPLPCDMPPSALLATHNSGVMSYCIS